MAPENDYYEVLGVSPTSTEEELRKAFRERVRGCHPDRVANLDEDLRRLAEEKMVGLNEAYAVLRNPARRAAYDARHRTGPAAAEAADPGTPEHRPSPAAQTGARREPSQPLDDPAASRNRIGEQQFVARAAAEEFQHTVKRCVTGDINWTPVAFRGATLALHGRRSRSNLHFVLLAEGQLGDKQVQRFFHSLESFGDNLKSRILGRDQVFGFAGAVEFLDQQRQRNSLERFNRKRAPRDAVQPATFIDLVNWHVVPGETSLQTRLEDLLKGR